MHRESEHSRVVFKDGSRAVALMDIKIDDQDSLHFLCSLPQNNPRGNRDVVEDTKAFAAIRERVMRAAGEVASEPHPKSRTASAARWQYSMGSQPVGFLCR
eukprot:CAMPEP_0181207424 /NCGR_PEP_ID=MMETSP1096-20121128/21578_1 /TAXON_ID=156174 ORGANISM="Chrysochromulina ericina, Strain CCMP281" /NCGR_SAMPLE_ID=MMETSP1096 /ASSEMBLY_ACC=CAM_ASM_000453 /LENGTH=100 /DNA_ID=CAMNT_0023298423 /DNA_START=796 /DNA_END=1098 /DNA_ORIENTATION=+